MSCSISSVSLVWLVACCRCFLTHIVLRVELNLFVYEVLLTSTIPIPSKWIIYPTSGIIYDPVNHPLNKFPIAVQDLWRDSTPPSPKKEGILNPPKVPLQYHLYLWFAGSRLKGGCFRSETGPALSPTQSPSSRTWHSNRTWQHAATIGGHIFPRPSDDIDGQRVKGALGTPRNNRGGLSSFQGKKTNILIIKIIIIITIINNNNHHHHQYPCSVPPN